ncbi:MAG: flagellar export protein FliJ [Clostridiales Family XIII bacterium]|jgi:flagellar export protein FliJ|nr:flagellar export protein FliJ [Clostridiales Family XIII bacterium]
MKKFQFKLDKLLDYKSKLLENEILALAALNAELAAVNRRMGDMAESVRANRSELQAAQLERGVTPALCRMYLRYEDFLKEEIAKAKRLAAQIERRIEKQIETVKELRLETRSMELLRESRLSEYRNAEVKENERQVEEYVNTSRLMRAAHF